MAEKKIGTTVYRQNLSPLLSIFRLMPEDGSSFPPYSSGQYIALRREQCRLTRKVTGPDGQASYAPDLDEQGNQQYGPVTHSYSISSAPYETAEEGYLEFYVILERLETGDPGRLTESLFRINPEDDNRIMYFSKIAGDFTLERRAKNYRNVVFVATGTGLAPFASMVKQLFHDVQNGRVDGTRYMLITSNRRASELGYNEQIRAIENSGKFDFVYVPSVSRPTDEDWSNAALGKGRANNLLRTVFGMPLKEEEDVEKARKENGNVERAMAALEKTVKPVLPAHLSKSDLKARFVPGETVLLTCGNPRSMKEIQIAAEANGIKVEKEEW